MFRNTLRLAIKRTNTNVPPFKNPNVASVSFRCCNGKVKIFISTSFDSGLCVSSSKMNDCGIFN